MDREETKKNNKYSGAWFTRDMLVVMNSLRERRPSTPTIY
jgi:hypothetical protein